MSDDRLPANAAAYCAEQVRAHDFGHYASTLFTGPAKRRALLALYAFNGEIVRVRDHISQPLPGEIRLQWWTDMLGGPVHGGVEGNPIAAELLAAIATFGLPLEPLTRMIEAHIFDLYDDPMSDLDALEVYFEQTDATLMMLAAKVCSSEPELPDDLVRHAGIAHGLCGVITRLPRHASRRQLYIPGQLLELNGVATEDIFAGRVTPGLRAVLAYLGREAETHLEIALGMMKSIPPELRAAFMPLVLIRKELSRMRRDGGDPFRPEPMSRLSILWALWRAARR